RLAGLEGQVFSAQLGWIEVEAAPLGTGRCPGHNRGPRQGIVSLQRPRVLPRARPCARQKTRTAPAAAGKPGGGQPQPRREAARESVQGTPRPLPVCPETVPRQWCGNG